MEQMNLTSSISISGVTGTGKTFGVCKLIADMGYKAAILDFENKTQKTVDLYFKEIKDQFEIYKVMLKRDETKTEVTKKGKSEHILFKNSPDYLRSFINLKDNLINPILERSDFDVLVFDGATPILRNHMGLEYWKMLHSVGDKPRESPMPEEWGFMNDIERSFIEAGIGWAEENNGLFIVTGQMKDLYRNDKVIGEIPAISMKLQHTIDVTLQLEKQIGVKTNYVCTCMDSIVGQWVEPLTMDRHISDILLEKELIGFD